MSDIKIDKGVPIPKRGNYNRNFPFGEMNVGDSFLIPSRDDQNIKSLQCQLMSNARSFILRRGIDWKFKSAIEKESVRIWRVK